MITRDQADEILKLAAHWAELADGKGWNEAHGEDVDPALISEAQQELRRYLDALVVPEAYDAEALRERVQAINASAYGGPVFRWDLPIDPEKIRQTADALNAQPPEFWQRVAKEVEARAKAKGPWDPAAAGNGAPITLTDQERAEIERPAEEQRKGEQHASKQNRTTKHHSGN